MLKELVWDRAPAVPSAAALSSGAARAVLVVADEAVIVAWDGAGAPARTEAIVRLGFVPDAVALSPSGRFVLVCSRAVLEVWDWQRGQRVLERRAADSSAAIVGGFARHEEREYLLCSDQRTDMEVVDLEAGRRVASCNAQAFRFAALTPVAAGAYVLALGFFDGETKESLTVIEVARLLAAPAAIEEQLARKRGIQDYAYRLCAGPCGSDAIVVFRDPETDEDDPLDEDGLAHGDVWGLRGLYVRGVDGALIDSIARDGPVRSYAPIAATRDWIACDCGGEIRFVSRSGGAAATFGARWLATAADGAHLLVQTREGGLAVMDGPP